MGMMIDGVWQVMDRNARRKEIEKFVRGETYFRNWITPDGAPGPTGKGGFKAEAGRYHLYISLACPWAHRTFIMRKIKDLDDKISLSVTHHYMGDHGWSFHDGEGVISDPILGSEYVHQVYAAAEPTYSGRVSVPVLWDKETATIVNNESPEIIRMFNSAFGEVGAVGPDYFPAELAEKIEAVNDRIYRTVNNGVYRSGFATTQDAYSEAVTELFETLDWLEDRLGRQRYLVGDQITEADWRLFPTLIRFDAVYHGHFKCNIRRIVDYPNLWGYTRELYQFPGIAETVDLTHIKHHYYGSHETVNPTLVVPLGPDVDFTSPHGRDALSKSAE